MTCIEDQLAFTRILSMETAILSDVLHHKSCIIGLRIVMANILAKAMQACIEQKLKIVMPCLTTLTVR